MKGRKIGSIEVTLSEMEIIAKMTPAHSRREIAEALNRSPDTIWRYQKKLDLL